MMTEKNAENAEKFYCEKCDFKCCKKSNYTNHITTRKHKNNDNELHKKEEKMPQKNRCVCGKEYTFRQGLYTHRKTCDYQKTCDVHENHSDNKIDFLIKENMDFTPFNISNADYFAFNFAFNLYIICIYNAFS